MSTPYNDLCTRITQLEVQNQQLKTHVDNLQNRYTAALALLAEMETKTREHKFHGWQLIENAPKDGTTIDLWVSCGKMSERTTDCFWHNDTWCWKSFNTQTDRWDFVRVDDWGEATHWMLSPKDPK